MDDFDEIVEGIKPGPLQREIQELFMAANDPEDVSAIDVVFPVTLDQIRETLDTIPDHHVLVAAHLAARDDRITGVRLIFRGSD